MALPEEGWLELGLPGRRGCPKLFYKFSVPGEHLMLLLTDLMAVWECSLDRDEILAEATRQHTSIDPSESPEQLRVLLSKIGQSLTQGHNSLARDSGKDGQALLLRTKMDLPRPLRALSWPFKLTARGATEMAERILRPCLHEVSVAHDKIESLLRVIKEKDHVLSRFLDKIGSSSFDLTLIFPGITGLASRKDDHVSVDEAKKHVPGMAGFDERTWADQFVKDSRDSGYVATGLRNLVRGCEKCFAHTRAEHEGWVENLPTVDKVEDDDAAMKTPPSTSGAKRQAPQNSDSETVESEAEFETQQTPSPKRRRKSPEERKAPGRKTQPVDEDTADDSTDAEAPRQSPSTKRQIGGLRQRRATRAFGASRESRRPSSPLQKPPIPERKSSASIATASASDSEPDLHGPSQVSPSKGDGQKKKLGGLGRKEAASSTHTTRSSSPAQETKSSSPVEASSRPPSRDTDTSEHPQQPAKAPSRRLGRLNRRTATKSPEPEPEPEAEPDSDSGPAKASTTKTATPSRRLGRLGGHKAQNSSPPTPSSTTKKRPSPQHSKKRTRCFGAESTSTSEPPTKDEAGQQLDPEPEPEETEDQKAERRRAELKRTLVAGQVGRKKRRF